MRPRRQPGDLPVGRHRTVALLGAVVLSVVVVGGVLAAAIPTGSRPRNCPQLFVPAFFRPDDGWAALAKAPAPPGTVLLDLTSLGAGTAPEAGFRPAVAALQKRGVTVLGYSTTIYTHRPMAQVVADVRHYASWYGVHDIFLDQVATGVGQLAYYRALQARIRAVEPKAMIWLNAGTYPARAYMGLGDIVVAFEGPWSNYRAIAVPGWARRYPRSRFAFVVYATPASHLAGTVRLAQRRNAGHLYVTDGTGGNPYGSLPSYFPALDAATAGCASQGS